MQKNQSTYTVAATIAVTFGTVLQPSTMSTLQLDGFLARQNAIDYRLYQLPKSSSSQSTYDFSTQDPSNLISESALTISPTRETTGQEKLIGELRRYVFLEEDWDGEGASKPNKTSLTSAIEFSRLIGDEIQLPEPLMNADGTSGLYWKSESLYAELSFLIDGRIAYFIQRKNDKHKGILDFKKTSMPSLFQVLLAV